ncbi:YtjB family periplasmic protein [Shewanella profunda]|uniref:YtjB family periplasmic protein n=1 Tax=Shewanella profunda TaxID=254793 RepID=UPI0035D792A8
MLYLKGLKKSHKISRLLQIAIALTLMVGLVQLWQTSLLQGQLLLKSQTQKMARLLVQQTAYSAAPALQLQNDEQLQWLASALVEDPKVMSAAIFSDQGIRLSFAQSITKEVLDPDSKDMDQLLSKYPPYVEPVLQEGKNLGYVEVRLDTKLFFNEIKEAHNLNMEQQQIMLLVAGLIGMLLSRALSFKRADFDRRRTRVKLRQTPKKNKTVKPAGSPNAELIASGTQDDANKNIEQSIRDHAKASPIKAGTPINQVKAEDKSKLKDIGDSEIKSEQNTIHLTELVQPAKKPQLKSNVSLSKNETKPKANPEPTSVAITLTIKPKVKMVRRVNTTAKTDVEKTAQSSDLDTDSTG